MFRALGYRLPFIALMGLLLVGPAMAQVFKWTDEQGKVHFSDQPSARHRTESVTVRVNSYSAVAAEASSVDTGGEVIMYSTAWCGYCKKARAYFKKNGIDYTDYDIETNRVAKMEHKELGGTGVPLILVGKKRLKGFSEEGFQRIYGEP